MSTAHSTSVTAARTGNGRTARYVRSLKFAIAGLSVVVLAVTGLGWHSVDSLRHGVATASGLTLGTGDGDDDDGATDILLVGTDSRTDAHGNPLSASELAELRAGDEVASNTDTIILIRVPKDGHSATALSIPRDSYVNVPGIGMTKINSAYGSNREATRARLVTSGVSEADAERQADQAGRQALIATVAGLTGITVDHYAEVGLLGFILLTDAVGGVDVCLNNPVNEPMSGAHFPAGPQTLYGSDALSFVRQRHDLPRGDLDRIVRQQVFMASLTSKILTARTLSSPAKLSQLSTALTRSVVLDSDWDILKFAGQMQDLSGGKVRFETIPVTDLNGSTDSGESIVRVDPDTVHRFVAALAGRTVAAPQHKHADVDHAGVTVDVANDTDSTGLAGQVADAVSALGFKRGETSNYTGTPVSATTVFAADADDEGALTLADSLGGINVSVNPAVPAGTALLVVAGDYRGPGSTAALASPGGTVQVAAPTPLDPPVDASNKGPHCVN